MALRVDGTHLGARGVCFVTDEDRYTVVWGAGVLADGTLIRRADSPSSPEPTKNPCRGRFPCEAARMRSKYQIQLSSPKTNIDPFIAPEEAHDGRQPIPASAGGGLDGLRALPLCDSVRRTGRERTIAGPELPLRPVDFGPVERQLAILVDGSVNADAHDRLHAWGPRTCCRMETQGPRYQPPAPRHWELSHGHFPRGRRSRPGPGAVGLREPRRWTRRAGGAGAHSDGGAPARSESPDPMVLEGGPMGRGARRAAR